jgi:hypothetical protein
MIISDLDHPSALADREAAKRHGVAGVELALGQAAAVLGISHRHRECGGSTQDGSEASEATSVSM